MVSLSALTRNSGRNHSAMDCVSGMRVSLSALTRNFRSQSLGNRLCFVEYGKTSKDIDRGTAPLLHVSSGQHWCGILTNRVSSNLEGNLSPNCFLLLSFLPSTIVLATHLLCCLSAVVCTETKLLETPLNRTARRIKETLIISHAKDAQDATKSKSKTHSQSATAYKTTTTMTTTATTNCHQKRSRRNAKAPNPPNRKVQ